MKKTILLIAFILYSSISTSQTQAVFFEQANEFFKNNVSPEGNIDYSYFKKSPGELLYILNNISNLNLETEEKNVQIAFWINAYNLIVIRNAVENYPLRSVNFVTGFFEKTFLVAGNEISLNDIEKKLNNLVKDPGIHFVLAKGSNSGPKLMKSAYLPETVLYQISLQLKSTINKPEFAKINKEANTIELPKVFELYKDDFVTSYFNEIDFINVFLDKKIESNKLKISYAYYDWSLNEIK